MINVSCDFCFHKYRVKPEHAGKSFHCKQCGELVQVPAAARPSAKRQAPPRDPWDDMDLDAGEAIEAPPVVRRKSSSGGSGKKRKRQSRAADASPWGMASMVTLGVLAVGILIGFFVPAVMAITSMIAMLIGAALAAVGAIMVMVTAFQEDIVCGLLYLFVPFYGLYYLITRWSEVGKYFMMALGGYVMIIVVYLIMMASA